MDRTDVERRVISAIERVTSEFGLSRERIRPDASLIDDIGLDSLRFVNLTVELENALELDVFPMQRWADDQLALAQDAPRFLVSQLVSECVRLVALRGAPGQDGTSALA